MKWQPEFRGAIEAFNTAIDKGLLEPYNMKAENYVGNYSFIHSSEGIDYFRHTITRQYLAYDRINDKIIRGGAQ